MWALSSEDEWLRRKHLAWSRSRSDGTWTQTRYLDEQIKDAVDYMSLSMNAHGEAIVVSSGQVTRAARFGFGKGWTRPTELPGWIHRSMLTESGTAVAVLFSGDGRDNWMLQESNGSWRLGGRVPSGEQLDADGSGQRMLLLYYNRPTLGSSDLDLPVR